MFVRKNNPRRGSMSFLKHTAKSFDTNGTEGMLDVILGCTLVFILLSSLIQVGQAQAQEKTLPAMNLTKTSSQQAGSTRIKKTNISIKKANGKMKLFFRLFTGNNSGARTASMMARQRLTWCPSSLSLRLGCARGRRLIYQFAGGITLALPNWVSR